MVAFEVYRACCSDGTRGTRQKRDTDSHRIVKRLRIHFELVNGFFRAGKLVARGLERAVSPTEKDVRGCELKELGFARTVHTFRGRSVEVLGRGSLTRIVFY
nr:hypothetical protein CFP56_77198 [Quercus suber]